MEEEEGLEEEEWMEEGEVLEEEEGEEKHAEDVGVQEEVAEWANELHMHERLCHHAMCSSVSIVLCCINEPSQSPSRQSFDEVPNSAVRRIAHSSSATSCLRRNRSKGF